MQLVEIVPIVIMSALAFWRLNAVLFMITAGMSVIMGFYWYDALANDAALAVGLMLVAYGFLCVGFAFRCIFWNREM